MQAQRMTMRSNRPTVRARPASRRLAVAARAEISYVMVSVSVFVVVCLGVWIWVLMLAHQPHSLMVGCVLVSVSDVTDTSVACK